jgi:hypothetical protein
VDDTDSGTRVIDHPQYRMWKDRLDNEAAQDRVRMARRAAREAELAGWYEAWHRYKARLTEAREPLPRPGRWDLWGWVRWLMHLHAPGRPD